MKRLLLPLSRSSLARQLYASLGRVPVLAGLSRRIVRGALPYGTREWVTLPRGGGAGMRLRLDPRYELDYWSGDYERDIQRFLEDHLQDGETFFDVGAHIGFFTIVAARLVGPHGRVVALEPDPQNAARVREHVAANGMGHVTVLQAAAWSDGGVLRFGRGIAFSSGKTGAVVAAGDAAEEVIEVQALSLDSLLQRFGPPALLKMDVEGGELDALRGATRLLQAARSILLCEVHGPEQLAGFHEIARAADYDVAPLRTGTVDFPAHYVARPRGR